MSILIKGMEMPASCLACPMREQGTIHEWELYCGLTGDYIGHWDDKSLNNGHRPDVCPLVEVPPHGRLVDADALKATFCAECNHTITCEDCDIDYHFGRLAPTIIEAEEGDPMNKIELRKRTPEERAAYAEGFAAGYQKGLEPQTVILRTNLILKRSDYDKILEGLDIQKNNGVMLLGPGL